MNIFGKSPLEMPSLSTTAHSDLQFPNRPDIESWRIARENFLNTGKESDYFPAKGQAWIDHENRFLNDRFPPLIKNITLETTIQGGKASMDHETVWINTRINRSNPDSDISHIDGDGLFPGNTVID